MPELPEVETTRRGIVPHVIGRRVSGIIVREPRLRWPVPSDLPELLSGQMIETVERRGKYLLLGTADGTLLIHLGMSGNLRILREAHPVQKHDHVDILLESGDVLRYNDPRRFGTILWLEAEPLAHPLLRNLGPEPLSDDFTGAYLFQRSRGRTGPIKSFIMDSHIVVGVGNIYANESLFLSGIHPERSAGRIGAERYERLANHIKDVLRRSIEQGGTTLRDFVGGDGKPGYFQQTLLVYGRSGEPCPTCSRALKETRLGQRTTVFCTHCQR